MRSYFKITYLAFATIILIACSPKLVQVTTADKSENLKTNKLVEKLDSLVKNAPADFYGKASTNFKDKNKDLSFKTSIKIKSDSAVTALITFAGIPIVNSIITVDSVKYQNKKDKCYSENSIDFFRSSFGYPFEFDNVVELLLGLPLAFDKENKYFQLPDNVYHVISTHKKRKLKNMDSNFNSTEDDIIIKYFLVKEGDILEKIEIESPNDKVKISVVYGQRSTESINLGCPQQIYVNIKTPNNEMNIRLDFDKIEVNIPQEINYTVPKNYESCK